MRESFFLTHYKQYLRRQKISTATVDNYLVDGVQFLRWLGDKLRQRGYQIIPQQPATFISYLNQRLLLDYFNYLATRVSAPATRKRRIAGVKKLLEYAIKQGYLDQQELALKKLTEQLLLLNPARLLVEFKQWLQREKTTELTIKNYLSDIRHLLNFIQTQRQ